MILIILKVMSVPYFCKSCLSFCLLGLGPKTIHQEEPLVSTGIPKRKLLSIGSMEARCKKATGEFLKINFQIEFTLLLNPGKTLLERYC